MGGGGFQPLPPAGGEKSRDPAERGLNVSGISTARYCHSVAAEKFGSASFHLAICRFLAAKIKPLFS